MTGIIDLGNINIGSPAPGVFLYAVPSASMQVLETLINETWSLGLSSKEEFSAKIAAAYSDLQAVGGAVHIAAGTAEITPIVEPSVVLPGSALRADAYADFTDRYMEIATYLIDKRDDFLATHFPADDAGYASAIGWIQNTIGSMVVPDAVSGTVSSTSVLSEDVSGSSVSGTSVSSIAIPSDSVSAPAVIEPSVYIPSSIDTSGILALFDSIWAELVVLLKGEHNTYLDTYFPSESGVYDSAEAWLNAALANTGTAMPQFVADQIVADDSARQLKEKNRRIDAVIAQFSSRRFPLPVSAAASAVLQLEQNAQDNLAESSRKISMTSIELMQKAVDRAFNLRVTCMQAASDFIKAIASAPEIASKLVGIGIDAQAHLISAVASLLNARTEVAKLSLTASTTTAQLALEADKTEAQLSLDAGRANQSTNLEASKTTAQIALEAAKTSSALSLEAEKANQGASLEAAKFTMQVAVEVAKANQSAKLSQLTLAVEKMTAARRDSVNAASEYMAKLIGSQEVGSKVVASGFGAESQFISAISSFLNARAQAAEVTTKAHQYNNSITFDADKVNQAADLTIIEAKLKALLQECTLISQTATALFNNLHAQVSMSANGSTISTQSQSL